MIPALIKRGRMWYSNIPVRRYGADGKIARRADGSIIFSRIRWALDTDRELASEQQTELLKIRRLADQRGIPFKRQYELAHQRPGGSWSAFTDGWLRKRKLDFQDKTWQHDERAIRAFNETARAIGQAVGNIADVNPKLLDAVRLKWIEDKKPASAINRAVRSIKHLMRNAAGFGDAPVQDWSVVKKAAGETEHREFFWDLATIKQMLRRLPLPYRTAVMLGARNGRRPGEIFFLQWSGVDFKNRTIRNPEIPGVWKPKTKKSASPTPMENDLYLYLKGLRKRSDGQEWVISAKGWDRTDLRSFWVQFKKYLLGQGIRRGSGHTLRHTFASHLVQDGVDLYSVSKLMRHSSIAQTERYAHLRPPDLMAAARRLRHL